MKKFVLLGILGSALVVGAKEAPKSAAKEKKLCKLGLVVPTEKNLDVSDMGDFGCMVSTSEAVYVIKKAEEADPTTIEKATAEAQETYSGDQLQTETLANGHILTYHNKTEEGGDNYFVSSALTINNKTYYVSALLPSEEMRQATLVAIKKIH